MNETKKKRRRNFVNYAPIRESTNDPEIFRDSSETVADLQISNNESSSNLAYSNLGSETDLKPLLQHAQLRKKRSSITLRLSRMPIYEPENVTRNSVTRRNSLASFASISVFETVIKFNIQMTMKVWASILMYATWCLVNVVVNFN
jgi:hypothetical protein